MSYHDLLIMSMSLSDIAILNIKGSDYRCIISLISKNEGKTLMQNADSTKKVEHYEPLKNYYHILKWVKKFQRLEILKLKKINFTAIRFLSI